MYVHYYRCPICSRAFMAIIMGQLSLLDLIGPGHTLNQINSKAHNKYYCNKILILYKKLTKGWLNLIKWLLCALIMSLRNAVDGPHTRNTNSLGRLIHDISGFFTWRKWKTRVRNKRAKERIRDKRKRFTILNIRYRKGRQTEELTYW
jgi:hypothetical protein